MSLAAAQTTTVRITGFGPPDAIAVDVDLDDAPYTIVLDQPHGWTAARWAALDAFLDLFPGALPEDQRAFWDDRLADPDDPMTNGAARMIAYALAKRVYGMEWWAAHRLCARAAANWWQYEAWSVTRGFDPRTAPAARIAASCWAWAAAQCDKEEDLDQLHRDVFTAPPGLGHEERMARARGMLAQLTVRHKG